MTLTLTWEALASLAFVATSLLTLVWWIIKLTIHGELDSFKTALMEELRGPFGFVPRGECQLKSVETERRLSALESIDDRLRVLEARDAA